MRPVFADPTADVVFRRIFGDEANKRLLIALLDDLLALEDDGRICEVEHISLNHRVAVPEVRLSIVDVMCTTATGRRFVVEAQAAKSNAVQKRILYNAAKAYGMQLQGTDEASTPCNVVGVTICDFALWPEQNGAVPMLSRWRMRERKSVGLPQVQYVFLELPKYAAGAAPQTRVDKWAYFFREASHLEVVPPALAEGPVHEALELARSASFSPEAWEAYERAEGARAEDVLAVLRARGVTVPDAARERILLQNDPGRLRRWLERAAVAASIDDVLAA